MSTLRFRNTRTAYRRVQPGIFAFALATLLSFGASCKAQEAAPVAQAAPTAEVAATPAPDAAPAEQAPAKGTPRIEFEKTDINLGDVVEGKDAEIRFPFTNKGDAPLEIQNVQKSCGCTKAETTKKVLQPGEKAEILGAFTTAGREGVQTKTLTVATNDPANRSVHLQFTANVKALIRVEPRKFISFNEVPLEQTRSETITIRNLTQHPMRVKSLSCSADQVVVRVVSPLPDGAAPENAQESAAVTGESTPVVIEATLKSGTQSIPVSGQVVVELEGEEVGQTLRLPISARVVGDLVVVPLSAYFGSMPPTEKKTRNVTLSSRSRIPFEIAEIDKGDMPVTVETEKLTNDKGFMIKITVDPTEAKDANISGELKIKTTHPKEKYVTVKVVAVLQTAVAPPPPRILKTEPTPPATPGAPAAAPGPAMGK